MDFSAGHEAIELAEFACGDACGFPVLAAHGDALAIATQREVAAVVGVERGGEFHGVAFAAENLAEQQRDLVLAERAESPGTRDRGRRRRPGRGLRCGSGRRRVGCGRRRPGCGPFRLLPGQKREEGAARNDRAEEPPFSACGSRARRDRWMGGHRNGRWDMRGVSPPLGVGPELGFGDCDLPGGFGGRGAEWGGSLRKTLRRKRGGGKGGRRGGCRGRGGSRAAKEQAGRLGGVGRGRGTVVARPLAARGPGGGRLAPAVHAAIGLEQRVDLGGGDGVICAVAELAHDTVLKLQIRRPPGPRIPGRVAGGILRCRNPVAGRDLRGGFAQLQAVAGGCGQGKKQRERQVLGWATEVHFQLTSRMLTKGRLGFSRAAVAASQDRL